MAEYWAERENVKLTHLAYKGSGQAMNDLVAGHVKMGSLTWTSALGQMRAGAIIPIAVSSARRMPGFPDVPTMKELGYADLVVTTWFGLAAPAGLPPAITNRMNGEANHALDTAAVRDRLMAQGFELETMTPAELTAYIGAELTKWGPLAKKVMAAGAAK
jgi:tripartite-type tricarboxylate transporter receptor subunit TctC